MGEMENQWSDLVLERKVGLNPERDGGGGGGSSQLTSRIYFRSIRQPKELGEKDLIRLIVTGVAAKLCFLSEDPFSATRRSPFDRQDEASSRWSSSGTFFLPLLFSESFLPSSDLPPRQTCLSLLN